MKPHPTTPPPPSKDNPGAERDTSRGQERRAGERSGAGADAIRPYLEQERRDRAAPNSEAAPRRKENALLRAIHKLVVTDILQLANDPLLYRVVALEKLLSGRFKVSLRSLDEATGVMLVRSGSDHVSVLTRAELLP